MLGKVAAGNFSKGSPATLVNGSVVGAGNKVALSAYPTQDFGNPVPGKSRQRERCEPA
jgi:hypothetical protein